MAQQAWSSPEERARGARTPAEAEFVRSIYDQALATADPARIWATAAMLRQYGFAPEADGLVATVQSRYHGAEAQRVADVVAQNAIVTNDPDRIRATGDLLVTAGYLKQGTFLRAYAAQAQAQGTIPSAGQMPAQPVAQPGAHAQRGPSVLPAVIAAVAALALGG